jgi:hypothetical protein
LIDPALDTETYGKALLLARNGLWSISWQWLESLKRQSGKKWSATAQAQLELIHWHAQATQAQAEQSWASPDQQVLANLVDGRWLRALSVFEASPENSLDTANLLKADSGRLQSRVEAALQINPAQFEVKAWGALLMAAQRGQSAAIAWLKKQPKTTSTDVARISRLTQRLTQTEWQNPELKEPTPVQTKPTPTQAEPTPVPTEPAPVQAEPTPVSTEPAPVQTNPASVQAEPAPVKTKPATY